MKDFLKLDHVGYAVNDIAATAVRYIKGGWQLSEIYDEVSQNTQIAFLTKEGFPKIELVAPNSNGKNPISNVLKHSGVTPYHLCYEVEDIYSVMESLYDDGFIPLFTPTKSIAMQGRLICYLRNLEVGTIELVSRI